MADVSVTDGEFSDDRAVEIAGDESSSKISGLTQKVTDLEQANAKIIKENETYKSKVEELKVSVEELHNLNEVLKKQVEEAETENGVLGNVAARAAELEAEVSRLQHDLVSNMSDLEESNTELSGLKNDLEGVQEREKGKDVELAAAVKERDLLVDKVEKLEGVEIGLRVELEAKEKEIKGLKKNVDELEKAVGSSKSLEKLKNELEKVVEKMKVEISVLESSLEEKEKVISGFEMKERALAGGVNGGINGGMNGVIVGEGGKKGLVGEWKQKDLLLVGGSTIAAVAVMGVACYVHIRKH